MSLAINAASFESDTNLIKNIDSKNNSLKGSHLSSKLQQYLSKSKNHKKTQRAIKEGFEFKMDENKMKALMDNVEDLVDDDTASIGDYHSQNNLLPPPESAGTEKTKLKDNQGTEGFEPLYNEDSQLDLNDYGNYGNDNDNEEYYRRMMPGYKNVTPNINLSANSNNDTLLKKINYMIQLLEEQQDEKTNNVTEEVVLYSFLGVFMIFIVDSFSKVGKYVR
jgi:CRISPR/Cas system-associated endoribonuclease Cas2